MRPIQQIQSMLGWFIQTGVSFFDIHVRVPKFPGADYNSDDWFMITAHEQVNAEKILTKLYSWLRYRNSNGADIFFRPCGAQDQPILFLDDLPLDKAHMVARKYGACIVETSLGNTQVWLATTEYLCLNRRKLAQRHIASLGFSDPGSTSGNHLGRLCGVKSQKRKCWVNLIATTQGQRYIPVLSDPSLPLGVLCASKTQRNANDKSPSEREFGWVLGRLRHGVPTSVIRNDLLNAATSRGKRNASTYVERTLKKAISLLDQT